MSSQLDEEDLAQAWKFPGYDPTVREHVAIVQWLDEDCQKRDIWVNQILEGLASPETRVGYSREGNAFLLQCVGDQCATVTIIDRSFPAAEGPAEVPVERICSILKAYRPMCH